MTTQTIAPVRRDITVEVGRQRAFEFFTGQMARWWNPRHHIADQPFVDLVVEPREGGRWFERDAAGIECQWGTVLVWAPHERVVLGWQLTEQWDFDPDFLTEVEIRFVPVGEGATRVELEHRDLERFGEHAEDIRSQLDADGGWKGLLDRFGEGLTAP
jgi:Activator of Hsp90 ATPase homolog 1-like protein